MSNGRASAPPNAASRSDDALSAPVHEPVRVFCCGAAEIGEDAEYANTVPTSAAATATRVPRALTSFDNMQPSSSSLCRSTAPFGEGFGNSLSSPELPACRCSARRTTHVCRTDLGGFGARAQGRSLWAGTFPHVLSLCVLVSSLTVMNWGVWVVQGSGSDVYAERRTKPACRGVRSLTGECWELWSIV